MNRVLVVDDEEEIVSLLKRTLSLEGFEVEGVSDGEKAVELMREQLFPIVILDIRLPETSGPELLKQFKDINPLVNVVMITGYSSMENVVDCLGGGAVDYFTKPLDMELFVKKIKEIDSKIDRWRKSIGMG
jgi:two-component system NtrC family response regulator